MRLNITQKIGFAVGIVLMLSILMNTLLTQPINSKNTTLIKGHFSDIQQQITRGQTSYNLFTEEDKNSYVISAGWAECFDYADFKNEVKQGQSIGILLKRDNNYISITVPAVVSIVANGRNYLNNDCINHDINKEKTEVPLIIVGFGVVLAIVIYIKKLKDGR